MPALQCSIVEICIFKRTKKGELYLILERADTERIYPGMWQIVTGKIRPAEKAIDAARREFREETGLTMRRFWVAPVTGSFFDTNSDTVQLCPLFAIEVQPDAEPVLSSEHKSYEWAGQKRAHELLVWPGHHEAVDIVHTYIVAEREAARLTELEPALAERKIP